MIRIDEIYNNVFLPRAQARPGTALHWFDPFGSVKIENLVCLPPVRHIANRRIIFWDQEPLHPELFVPFMEKFLEQYLGPLSLVTSELDSETTDWARDTYGLDHHYYFFHGWAALDWYRGYDHSFLWNRWIDRDIVHRIFCPNNIVSGSRNHRARLVSGMDQKNLINNNMVSFPAHCPYSGKSSHEICLDLGLVPIRGLPLQIDSAANHAGNSHRIDFHDQAVQCFCHVVTETLYHGRRYHLTEKTFKPIVMQQPFILVAPQHSLRYLRGYGFKTFDTIWDETYDTCDDDERIDAILDVLQDVNSWTHKKMIDAQHQIHSIVQHNHDWFYSGFQNLLWQELCLMIDQWP